MVKVKRRYGENHHRAKFTDHEISLIRELRESGMSYSLIAEKMESCKSHIWDIVHYYKRSFSV